MGARQDRCQRGTIHSRCAEPPMIVQSRMFPPEGGEGLHHVGPLQVIPQAAVVVTGAYPADDGQLGGAVLHLGDALSLLHQQRTVPLHHVEALPISKIVKHSTKYQRFCEELETP